MTDSTRGPKPDGSAYKEHMAEIDRRNGEARKRGKAKREEKETANMRTDRANELRQNTELRGSKNRGGSQLD
ncbi:MAG TPA: hypothetical protein VEX39_02675 [Thermoleophilaceae bacterium]|nr:hypothetical protein [Thermoleophilaceae bacterium]